MRHGRWSGVRRGPLWAALLAAFGVQAPAAAQLPPVPGEIEALDFLIGEWEGNGWIEWMPGRRGEFRGTERVERRMGGRLVVVEGDFSAAIGPGGEERPVHQAFGVFFHDPRHNALRFRTWLARGPGSTHAVAAEERRLVWGYEDPRMGTVTYTIRLAEDGSWHETGRASRDGESWTTFFEMTLRRKDGR